jgi:hypothetical protein
MAFCKYKNSLGIPGKGFHVHFLGVAIFDLLGTLLICYGIWRLGGWKGEVFWLIFAIVMVITVALHRLFCVNTTLNKAIFGTV